MNTFYYTVDFDSLVHHGVKGQKWGERKYQNKDGSLTPEGYRHWGVSPTGGNRLTSKGRGKNAVKVANAIAKRDRQQAKLDKAVAKAEKSGDKNAIAEAKRNAKAFKDAGKGFTKSMNAALKGTSSVDVENYLKRSNDNRITAKAMLGGVAGLTVSAILTGGASLGVGTLAAIGLSGTAGLTAGNIGGRISAERRNRRVRNTVNSLKAR